MKHGMKKLVSGLAIAALVVALMAFATGSLGAEKVAAGRDPELAGLPTPQRTATAERVSLEQTEPAVGTVRSRHVVVVAAQVGGTILSVGVEAGQRVTSGTDAVRLDDRDLTARVTQARQGLAAAEAAVSRAQEGKSAGEARLEQARAAHERVKGFVDAGAATPEQLEAAQAAFLEARAAVAGAEAAIAAALAQREQAHAAVTSAEVALGYTRVAVPIDGVVSERSVEAGDLAWPGRPLFTVLDPGQLRLEARVREGLIARVASGAELEVELPGIGRTTRGRVTEVLPAADARSRTFEVRVQLEALNGLLPGMYGRLLVPVGAREVVRVPAQAVARVGQLETVVVQRDGQWRRALVTTGQRFTDGTVEVLSGLVGGETVGLEGPGR